MVGAMVLVAVLVAGRAVLADDDEPRRAVPPPSSSVPSSAPVTTAATADRPTTTGITVPAAPRSLALFAVRVDAGGTVATVQLDGVTYDAAVGDAFAPGIVLETIDGPCARFVEANRRIALCEGQAAVI